MQEARVILLYNLGDKIELSRSGKATERLEAGAPYSCAVKPSTIESEVRGQAKAWAWEQGLWSKVAALQNKAKSKGFASPKGQGEASKIAEDSCLDVSCGVSETDSLTVLRWERAGVLPTVEELISGKFSILLWLPCQIKSKFPHISKHRPPSFQWTSTKLRRMWNSRCAPGQMVPVHLYHSLFS